MTAVITTDNLEIRYDDTVALSSLDLVTPAATSLAVIGPNGSGKSSLLGALAGTISPTTGSTAVKGGTPALVLQATNVDDGLPLTVRDAVAIGRYPRLGLLRRFRSIDNDAVDRSLARMQIEDLASHQLNRLSGGQRQRVLIAQGLAQEADVLLLDEPMTGVDVASRAVILDVIDEEVAAGRTVVMTTHSFDDARRCDTILLLDTRPIAMGPAAMVLTEENLRQVFGTSLVGVGDSFFHDHHHDC